MAFIRHILRLFDLKPSKDLPVQLLEVYFGFFRNCLKLTISGKNKVFDLGGGSFSA